MAPKTCSSVGMVWCACGWCGWCGWCAVCMSTGSSVHALYKADSTRVHCKDTTSALQMCKYIYLTSVPHTNSYRQVDRSCPILGVIKPHHSPRIVNTPIDTTIRGLPISNSRGCCGGVETTPEDVRVICKGNPENNATVLCKLGTLLQGRGKWVGCVNERWLRVWLGGGEGVRYARCVMWV